MAEWAHREGICDPKAEQHARVLGACVERELDERHQVKASHKCCQKGCCSQLLCMLILREQNSLSLRLARAVQLLFSM